MDYRIIDILVYLARQLQQNSFSSTTEVVPEFDLGKIVFSLQNEGYSPSEIDSALSWYFENEELRPQWLSSQKQLPLTPTAVRILHPYERTWIRPEAFGFLTQIHQLGLISSLQMESIIEKALGSGWEVDLSLVKTIASTVLFERDEFDFGDGMGYVI